MTSKPDRDDKGRAPSVKADAKPDNPNKEFGEGNYKATRDYNDATERFIKSGKVDQAARAARPASAEQARELEHAEQVGRSKSKDKGGASVTPGKHPSA